MKKNSIRFIYATDLHGNISKYQKILEFALKHGIKLIHLGADILPKEFPIQRNQKKFINNFLKEYYQKCDKEGIKLLTFFGNDDLYSNKEYFRKYGSLLDENPEEFNGFTFKAYGYVSDHPFGLKNGCKWDYEGFKSPEINPITTFIIYEGEKIPIQSVPKPKDGDLKEILNLEEYFKKQGTIEDDLKDIHVDDKTIMAMHMPPCSLGLDVCYGNRYVGSRSVLNWIVNEQPLLFLSGHIHKSPEMSGIWKTKVEKTLVIQPGQKHDRATFVHIEIDGERVDAQIVYR